MAYVDPGNFDDDIVAGAQLRYHLLWVILLASALAFLLQSLASKLGIVTRLHLAELCREEYGSKSAVSFCLLLCAELSVACAEIPGLLGGAMALRLLFGAPLWAGVVVTASLALLILVLPEGGPAGMRKLEILIGVLVGTISMCFLVELFFTDDIKWVSKSLSDSVLSGFVPQLPSSRAVYIAASLTGSLASTHNLFLHSGLVLSRDVARTRQGLTEACMYNWIESGIAIVVAFFINGSLVIIASASFYPMEQAGLRNASELLDDVMNSSVAGLWTECATSKEFIKSWVIFIAMFAAVMFSVALFASAVSATTTGCLAGQFVWDGFSDWLGFGAGQLRKGPDHVRGSSGWRQWQVHLLARAVTLVPTSIVCMIYAAEEGMHGGDVLIIFSQALVTFTLPFALIPLLRLMASGQVLGVFRSSRWVTTSLWVLGGVIITTNAGVVIGPLLSKEQSDEADSGEVGYGVLIYLVLAIFGAAYLAVVVYISCRGIRIQHAWIRAAQGDDAEEVVNALLLRQGIDESDHNDVADPQGHLGEGGWRGGLGEDGLGLGLAPDDREGRESGNLELDPELWRHGLTTSPSQSSTSSHTLHASASTGRKRSVAGSSDLEATELHEMVVSAGQRSSL